ncbi:hypothetical protein CGC47_07315 [Capnocytophaga canimorsus]|nr:hypothetical protein CGC47_07315 [Capnocytophaga canimorsus]
MLLKKFIILLFLTQFHLSWLLTKLKFSHPKKSSFKSTIKVNYFTDKSNIKRYFYIIFNVSEILDFLFERLIK